MKKNIIGKIIELGFIFQILGVLCCFAQTRESDQYYQQGIDNITRGNYTEAIGAFKKCQELDGTKTTPDFNISNNWHHWIGYCYYKNNDLDNARKYSDFYKFEPNNRLQIKGIDSIYYKVICFSKERKYQEALDCLNQIEKTLSSKFGKNNIYLNEIWEAQANMHFGLNHYMAATNILTKIWEIYNDSLGPCYERQKIGQELIRCYAAEGKRDKAITMEPLDSNTVIIRRTKTFDTGLVFLKDSITPFLLLPMKYRNIEKINDRFIFVTTDFDHHFIVDFSNWTFSKNITDYSVKYVTDVDGVPVFSTYEKLIDFNGRTKENKYSIYVGTEEDKVKFELDSAFYSIPKDSIMLSNNKVKFIFPSESKSNGKYGDYYVQHIINKDYIVVHNKIDSEIGLLKRTDSGIIQLLPCDYSVIDAAFDRNHFIIKQEQKHYIFNSENLEKTEISTFIDGFGSDQTFNYKGRKTIIGGGYRLEGIDIEGNVYHFPIGSWVEQDNNKYVFHYGDTILNINNVELGKMREYRIKKKDYTPNWRFSVRMDYPTDNSALSNNVRYWMSSLLSRAGNTYIPTENKSPLRMYQHYAYDRMRDAEINEDGNVLYANENDSIEYAVREEDFDAYRMWEDEQYVTYISGDTWFGGGAHGDSFTWYSTFSKKTGELLEAKDLFSKHEEKQVHRLLYDLIIQEQIKRTGDSEDDVITNLDFYNFTPENCPIGRLALTPKGVVFQYRAYELGAYALGSFSFTIPYNKLNDILILSPMSPASKNVFLESLQNANRFGEMVIIYKKGYNDQSNVSFIKKKYGGKSGEYLDFLLQTANDYFEKEDYNTSIKYSDEYSDLIKTIMPSRRIMSQGVENVFRCYLKKKDYEKAKEIGLELLKQYNETHYMNEMLDRYNYSERLSDIAKIYCHLGKPDSALFYQEQSVYYGSEYDDELYKNASIYAYKCNQSSKACLFAKYLLPNDTSRDNWMEELINSFKEATTYRRIELRNNQIPWYQNFLPDLAYKTKDSVIVESAFNAQLISKNLLLNTEQSLRSVILSSQDTTLINPYLKIQSLKKKLASIANDKSLDNDAKGRLTKSVKEEMSTLERQLIDKSVLYGDYIKKLKIDITQIRKCLKSGEIAVEFAVSSDSIYYALVLDSNNTCPQIIKLCTASDLISNKQHTYKVIWEPLMSSLSGYNTIYFSPAGELYNTPIEYAYSNDNRCINEDFQLYRLSSTREIVISRDSTYSSTVSTNGAVLYGYLDYYADSNYKTISEPAQSNNALSNIVSTRFSKKGRGLRANVGRLEYSKDEIHNIVSLIVSSHYANVDSVYENSAGTETSLKKYSRKQMRILHLATHGFYISKSEMENYKNFDFLSLENANIDEIEDKELVRSGLLFAGANHTLENDSIIPRGHDDGILTALEVASLDLIGLDLVVLSACQTAQGDLGEDGVLGLQRGFKKAGANSILMSLWKVDDKATQILMTQFYKHLVSGQSKRQSLQSAQKYLRMYRNEKGEQCYNEPKYWAAFILLDGIK